MNVPFVDLRSQYRELRPAIDAAVLSVLESGSFVLGKALTSFEEHFAAHVGVRHCVGTSSGTDALELAIRACDLRPGDEVITTPNTFIATAAAATAAGATVRFVESDSRTYTMDPAKLEQAIGPRSRIVLPVHLYGQPCDIASITAVARKHGLLVIEDCAQAHGAEFEGRKVGTFGVLSCYSFYPGKNLGAYGDGGAICTDDDDLAERVRLLRNHGSRQKYRHEVVGYCRRLDDVQAAVLDSKLPHLDRWNAQRRRVAAVYDALLAPVPDLVVPFVRPNAAHVFHLYVVQIPNRDEVKAGMAADGIETGIHYPIPLHEQPAYKHLQHEPSDFPIAHEQAGRLLSLPMFPEITDDQIAYVVESLTRRLLGRKC